MFMVALGGYETSFLNSVEIFSSVTETWTFLPNMSIVRGDSPTLCAAGVSDASWLIVCGGHSSSNAWLDSCEMLDLTNQTGEWKLIASMNASRGYASGILLPDGNSFLVIGGWNGLDRLSSCEKLDVAANVWSTAASLPSVLSGHCTVMHDNKVIVLGGVNQSHYLNSCLQYNYTSNTWSPFPSFSTPRETFGAAVVRGKIYIAGGSNGTTILSSAEVYDGTIWSLLSFSLAETRYSCAAVAFQDRLVVLGGDRTTIEVFDPLTSTWNTTFPRLIGSSRRFLAAISFESMPISSSTSTATSTSTSAPTSTSTSTST
jgi:hypothetical protein